MKRFMYIVFFMIATIFSVAVETVHAQSIVQIPDPLWPLDSVINGSVKRFEVLGDQNYDEPSTFTWTVYGGRLFFDEALTLPAGDGYTVTVLGDSITNSTEIYVIWDVFNKHVDYGYIYVTEVSADGCEKFDYDRSKYSGLNMKVIAPPDIRFLRNETITCSNHDGVNVEIEFAGFPPFDLTYALNGDTILWHVTEDDVVDSDFDGEDDNLVIVVDDYPGTDVDLVYDFELIKAESDGISGKVLQYPRHIVYAYVQPDAPAIFENWTQVTTNETHLYMFSDQGTNVAEWYWELYSTSGELFHEFNSTTQAMTTISFNIPTGSYYLVAYYLSNNGCYSLSDTLEIDVFPPPTIGFADASPNVVACSAVSTDPDDSFEFYIDYQGALGYEFAYEIVDFRGFVEWGDTVTSVVVRNPMITIPNTFINDYTPEIDRKWTVRIIYARNEEGRDVEILDGTIIGGRDERTMRIHPKPVIVDDIDFAN